jgi:hypothetical protein
MKRPLQVYLDGAEFARLDAWSKERGWTKSQAIRAAVRALTQPRAADPVLALSGMVSGGLPRDASEQFDRYLEETFVAETAKPYRRRKTKPRLRR